MAEPEASRLLVGDEHAVLHCLAQELTQIVFGYLRGRLEERIADVASRGRRHTQHALRCGIETTHALQEKITQAAWKLPAPVTCGGEELLGEERVALRAGHDRVRHGRRQGIIVTRE